MFCFLNSLGGMKLKAARDESTPDAGLFMASYLKLLPFLLYLDSGTLLLIVDETNGFHFLRDMISS